MPSSKDVNHRAVQRVQTASTPTSACPTLINRSQSVWQDTVTVAVQGGLKNIALDQLAALRALIANPPVSRFQFWGDGPLRYLEILLWGLAGILVSKIIQVGWYLRSQTLLETRNPHAYCSHRRYAPAGPGLRPDFIPGDLQGDPGWRKRHQHRPE